MQKIAQNVGTSIDSLNAKISWMQNELSSLKVQNKGISDSLKTLNETLKTEDIKTSFYDTHLATYTAIFILLFTILLTFIGLFSWRQVLIPLKKQLMQDFHKEISKHELETFKANSWGLRAMFYITYETQKYEKAFQVSVALLSFIVKNKNNFRPGKFESIFKIFIQNSMSSLTRSNPNSLIELINDDILVDLKEIEDLSPDKFKDSVQQIIDLYKDMILRR